VGKSKKVVQFPDFTLAVSPSEDACLSASGRVLVVPNYRMLDKRDANLDYITFLVRAFALIRAKGLDPAFLIHDAVEDLRIVDLARNEGLSAEVISHDDPRVLKKLLAEASFVIGSRFHSLVSALSQSTPCIGCGWSHKYKELFSDFECPEMLLEDFGNHDSLVNKVNALTCAAGRAEAVSNIQNATRALKIKVDTMWELVESVLASASGKGLTAKR
jgi:colanic acid/amylovoran biosynthesis protein